MIDNPIFIVGSARSGTVFLGQVLKKHLGIHCLIERPSVFNFASYIALNPSLKKNHTCRITDHLRRLYSKAWSLDIFSCHSCSVMCKKAGGVSRIPWSTCQREKSIKRYCDKSHQHILNISILLNAFPNAQFIHLIRDGRDVVSSMLCHPGVLSWFSETHINESTEFPSPWFGVNSVEHFEEWSQWSLAKKCALRWVSWVHTGQKEKASLPKEQWLDIHYEDLVTRPFAVGEKIYSFLGLDFNFETLSSARSSSIGRWRHGLFLPEIDEVYEIEEETLVELGYLT
jgi:hypothetical protein